MTVTLTILAFIAGWCGTPYPRRWRFPWPWPPPPPEPDPICPVCGNILGAIGGIVLYAIISSVLPNEVGVVTSLVSGFVGGRFLNDIGGMVNPTKMKR